MSRLDLDFKLETRSERTAFLNQYIDSLNFAPTEDELETMANYILWGKNSEGLNGRQEGLDLETRFKTWDTTQVESLDALIEDPAFNEASLRPDEPPTFVRREVLSRSRIRRTAPPEILAQFEKLWK